MIHIALLAAAATFSLAVPAAAITPADDGLVAYYAMSHFGYHWCPSFKFNVTEEVALTSKYPFYASGSKQEQAVISSGIWKAVSWHQNGVISGKGDAPTCEVIWNALGPNGTVHRNIFIAK